MSRTTVLVKITTYLTSDKLKGHSLGS